MLSSTFLGSTRTNLSWLGCFLYSREVMMALSPTDFPCPVAPATRRWGALARSKAEGSVGVVLPRATGGLDLLLWDFLLAVMLRMEAISGSGVGACVATGASAGGGGGEAEAEGAEV